MTFGSEGLSDILSPMSFSLIKEKLVDGNFLLTLQDCMKCSYIKYVCFFVLRWDEGGQECLDILCILFLFYES